MKPLPPPALLRAAFSLPALLLVLLSMTGAGGLLAQEPNAGAPPGVSEPAAAKLDPRLIRRLTDPAAIAAGARIAVLITPRGSPAVQGLRLPPPEAQLPRRERHAQAVEVLRARAQGSQLEILAALRERERQGSARAVESLWIVNYVRAEVTPELLGELAERADVERIHLDRAVALDRPAEILPAAGPALAGQPSSALETARVPEAWDQGFTGKGMLLANLDSGVQGDHPALASKWRGLRAPIEQAWFDPFLNSTFPVDDDPVSRANGHGTATMGVLVGGERSIGVAYEGEWIAANIFENNQSFISTILKGLQWATDPDGDPATVSDVPDVINASFGLAEIDSLGIPTDAGLCDEVFDDAVDAAAAAGAVVVFSAGNFDVADAGDITVPASSLNAFAVGALDDSGDIADFSGRGPSLCEGADPDRIKPDLVAPGRNVRTLNRSGGEQFISGTSFSAPIVGGLAALVRQKNPQLGAGAVLRILTDTARDLGQGGPDNTFGAGLVDGAAAVSATPAGGPVLRLTGFGRPEAAGAGKPVPQGAPGPEGFFLLPGENVILVRVTNPTSSPVAPGAARLASASAEIEVLDADAELPELSAGEEAELSFRVRVADDVPAGLDLRFALSLPAAAGGPAIPFTLVVGEPVEGQFATHDANEIRVTLTNFGAIGFWLGVSDDQGRSNELLGDGFHFPADDETNYLFHASFLVGRSPQQVSDDLPYGNVAQSVNDFHVLPGVPFSFLTPGPVAAQEVVGAYDDSYNFAGEIGVSVRQHSYAFDEDGRRDFVLVTYDVANRSAGELTNLRAGLFADWDFLDEDGNPSETMDLVPELRLGVVEGPAGTPSLGIVALNQMALGGLSYRIVELADFQAREGGSEIRESDKFEFLSEGVPRESVDDPQDLAHVLGLGPETLAPGDSFQAAFAFVAGRNRAELRSAAARARSTYQIEILGREPPPGGIPSTLELALPFPNPLRSDGPAATIGFGIPEAGLDAFAPRAVSLRVLDVRGRVVRGVLNEELTPGRYERIWNGLDDEGRAVPSGVYAVLLETGSERALRKMVVVR
ncbi:MAG: S8 family serine peptidase [Gemmatimonadetes bacterium]|nr:S8 family serine peptidase [Gemmatimonadota bacterium]